jgi:hypothetical protein
MLRVVADLSSADESPEQLEKGHRPFLRENVQRRLYKLCCASGFVRVHWSIPCFVRLSFCFSCIRCRSHRLPICGLLSQQDGIDCASVSHIYCQIAAAGLILSASTRNC